MTNSEIRALVDVSKEWWDDNFDSPYFLPDMVCAIETLLAREAEVLDMLPEPPDGYMSETQYARAQLGDQIRAILNPEENSNG